MDRGLRNVTILTAVLLIAVSCSIIYVNKSQNIKIDDNTGEVSIDSLSVLDQSKRKQ